MSHQNTLRGTQRHEIQTGELRIKGQLILQDSPIFPSPQKKGQAFALSPQQHRAQGGEQGIMGREEKLFTDWVRLRADMLHAIFFKKCGIFCL